MLIPNKAGMMTHEQVGYILALADELGEFDKALDFIRETREKKEAEEMIERLEERITKQEVYQ